jgi:hypothetical protein
MAVLIQPKRWGMTAPPPGVRVDPSHPLGASCLAAYTMASGTTSWLEDATGRHPALAGVLGSLTWQSQGPFGPCLLNSSTGTYHLAQFAERLGSFSVAAWFRRDAVLSGATLCALYNGVLVVALLRWNGTQIELLIQNGAGTNFTAQASGVINGTGQWLFACGTWDAVTGAVNIYGAPVGQAPGPSLGSATQTGTARGPTIIYPRSRGGAGTTAWTDPIGPVYVFSRVLKPSDVVELGLAPFGMFLPQSPTLRFWLDVGAPSDVERTASGAATATGTAAQVSLSPRTVSGTSAGTGTASALGLSPRTSSGAATGTGTAAAVGLAPRTATGATTGSGTAAAAIATTASATTAGTGAAAAVGLSPRTASGSVVGVGTATVEDAVERTTTGTGSGVGTATAVGLSLRTASGIGMGTGAAIAAIATAAAGSASGTGTAAAGSLSTRTTTGSATGSGSAVAAALQATGPTADVADGGWTNQDDNTTDLYTSLDEAVVSDTDYIQSSESPASPDIVQIRLGALGTPATRTLHLIRYRYGADVSGPPPLDLTVRLLSSDGLTEYAAWQHLDVPDGWHDAQQTLTTEQAEAIDEADYSAGLILEFQAVLA